MNLAFVGTWEGAGLVGTPDIVYWYGSTDGGGTWAGLIPGVGSGVSLFMDRLLTELMPRILITSDR